MPSKRRVSDMLIAIGSILDISGIGTYRARRRLATSTSAGQEEDWKRVGADLRTVMRAQEMRAQELRQAGV